MATVVGNQVKLNNGQLITPSTGGWYDGQQFWNGTLSAPGVINSQSDQQGAGQAVNPEVIAAQGNTSFINQQQQNQPQPTTNTNNNNQGSTSISGGDATLPTNPTINLNDTYNSLINESGISGLETNVNSIESRINQMTSEAADAKSKVNENPWISESSRVGRIAKIDEKLQNAIAPLQKDVANITNQINQKKTDVSNKLNLTTQQYNIDVAKNQQNLTNFNSLLSSGALVNATAQDIATLAQQTGLAPSFIQSAIEAAKKAQNPLSVGTYTDNSGNLVAYTMDSQGNLVNSNKIGKVQQTSTSTAGDKKTANQQAIDSTLSANTNSYGHVSPAIWNAALKAYIADGLGSASEFNIMYGNLKDPNRTDEGSSTGYILVE